MAGMLWYFIVYFVYLLIAYRQPFYADFLLKRHDAAYIEYIKTIKKIGEENTTIY